MRTDRNPHRPTVAVARLLDPVIDATGYRHVQSDPLMEHVVVINDELELFDTPSVVAAV